MSRGMELVKEAIYLKVSAEEHDRYDTGYGDVDRLQMAALVYRAHHEEGMDWKELSGLMLTRQKKLERFVAEACPLGADEAEERARRMYGATPSEEVLRWVWAGGRL